YASVRRIALVHRARHNASLHTFLHVVRGGAWSAPTVGHGSCWEPGSMDAATPIPPADLAIEKAPMDALVIQGGRRLSGRVAISGAKNAALPVMAATLLAPGVHRLRNVPDLRDTRTFADVLTKLGARVAFDGDLCTIDSTRIDNCEAPYELVKTMR